jgi:hypothetical protein
VNTCTRCGEPTYGERHTSPDACINALLATKRHLIAALDECHRVMYELVKPDPVPDRKELHV